MIRYGIKIDGKYFKEYVYYQARIVDRYTGHTLFGNRYQEGDITDIITTDEPERLEVSRSIGNTISTLVSIGTLKGKVIEIVPIAEV